MLKNHSFLFLSLLLASACGSPRDTGDDTDTGPRTMSARFTVPAEEAEICGITAVEATVSNATPPVTLTFLLDGETLQTLKEMPYRASLDTTVIATGRHVLSLIAVDSAQHTVGASRSVTVVRGGTCDNPPTVTFDPNTPSRASKLTIKVKANAADDVGIAKVQFFTGATLFAEVTQPPYEVNWDPRPFEAGTYELKAMAFDTKNQTASDTHQVVINRTPPLVTLTAPTEGQAIKGSILLSASISNDDDLSRLEFFVDDQLVGTVLSSPYDFTLTTLASGTHSAHAEVWDTLGNTSSSGIVNFTYGGSDRCSSRCDCTGFGEICSAGHCVQAAADQSCVRDDQCALGTICDFSRTCVPGCAAQCDCSGGKLCNTTTLQCEVCSNVNPCPQGQVCTATGTCESQKQCTTNAQCSAGQVCKSSVCDTCRLDSDCKSYSNTARCSPNGLCHEVCTDAGCQTALGDAKAYCDVAANTCKAYECIGDSDCSNGDKCDLARHECVSSVSCAADCNGQDCAAQSLVCDPATCTCTAASTISDWCGPQNAGIAVKPDCTACGIADLLGGICVDAADNSYHCNPSTLAIFYFQTLGYGICE